MDRKSIYSTEILGIPYRVFVRPLPKVESDSEGITNVAHSIIGLTKKDEFAFFERTWLRRRMTSRELNTGIRQSRFAQSSLLD